MDIAFQCLNLVKAAYESIKVAKMNREQLEILRQNVQQTEHLLKSKSAPISLACCPPRSSLCFWGVVVAEVKEPPRQIQTMHDTLVEVCKLLKKFEQRPSALAVLFKSRMLCDEIALARERLAQCHMLLHTEILLNLQIRLDPKKPNHQQDSLRAVGQVVDKEQQLTRMFREAQSKVSLFLPVVVTVAANVATG